jgi:hypothetical protein
MVEKDVLQAVVAVAHVGRVPHVRRESAVVNGLDNHVDRAEGASHFACFFACLFSNSF